MSYCRFENTCGDLADCVEAVQDAIDNEEEYDFSSNYEKNAFDKLYKIAQNFVDAYEEYQDMDFKSDDDDDDE